MKQTKFVSKPPLEVSLFSYFRQALERYAVPSLVSNFQRAVDFVSQTACSLIFKQASTVWETVEGWR